MRHDPRRGGDPRNRGRSSPDPKAEIELPAPGTPWARGREEVLALIGRGDLQQVVSDARLADRQLDQAQEFLDAARRLADDLPVPAFNAAYDASRLALTALLEHQGLRAKNEGTHWIIEKAARAQLGIDVGDEFHGYRSLRHASAYPEPDKAPAEPQDTRDAIDFAARLIPGVRQMLDQVGVFR